MNQYKKYMDRQGVSPSLHARLTALAEGDGPAPAGRAPHRYRWGILAACCVLAAGLAWAGGVRQPDGAAQAYSMDSAGMQSAQSGAAHQGGSEAMEEDEKQLSPPVWAVNYPDIGTLYRGEEGLGAALTDQAPAAETRSRALTPEELTTLFREDLLRELGWDCGQLGGEALYDASGALLRVTVRGGGVGEEAQTSFALTLAPGDLPSPGEAVPGGTVTEVNGTEVTAWRLTGDLDGDGRAEGLCHSQFLTGDMWVVLETESRASAGAEEPWEEAARWSDSFLSAVLQGERDALTLDHLLEAEP